MHANEQDAPFHMGKTQLAFQIWHCDESGQQLFPYDVTAVWINVQEIQSGSMRATRRVALHPCTEVTAQHLQEVKKWLVSSYRKMTTGCPTRGSLGCLLPGSGIVPHVYSSPPHSQSRGHCTADIPGPHPQASSSSSSLYGLKTRSKKKKYRKVNNSRS